MTAWETKDSNLFNQDLQQRLDDSTYSNILHHKLRVHTSRSKDSNFFLAHSQTWSILYSCPGGCLRNLVKVKKPLLIERAFQFELESKLSNGRERFVSFLHSRDVRVSRPACLHNQDTSNLSANLRTALPKKYLLTFHWFYSFKYQAASFWNCHAMKNMGLITRTYIHTWAWMRNPKAIFKEKVSLSRRKTPHCSVVVNSAGTSSKDIPHSMWVVLKRFRLSLTSELQDLILDSSDFCRQQKGC